MTDGTHKLVQYGTGSEVQPQLFNLSAGTRTGRRWIDALLCMLRCCFYPLASPHHLFAPDPAELVNLWNTSDAARALTSKLDAALRSAIDYPSVALDVAAYQRAQFRYWVNTTGPAWRKDIATGPRWAAAWALYPEQVCSQTDGALHAPM